MKMKYLAAAAIATCITAAPASAAVQFTGTTQGCFGASCVPSSGLSTDLGLTYASGAFSALSDASGFAALGGLGLGGNLGSFTLSTAADNYAGQLFTLLVKFTSPGTGNQTAQATLKGSVTNNPLGGGVDINFGGDPYLVTTNDGTSFYLTITNPIDVHPGSNSQITANMQAVPEAATWAMMLLGFGGMGLVMRSRRRPALAQVA